MNRFFVLMFVIGLQLLHSQSISSLNDSIRKYTIKDPEKALDFGYRAISTSDFNKLSWDVYDTNYLIGQTLYYINFEKESFDYLFQALRVFESLPVEQRLFKKITKPPWILVTLGNSYLNCLNVSTTPRYLQWNFVSGSAGQLVFSTSDAWFINLIFSPSCTKLNIEVVSLREVCTESMLTKSSEVRGRIGFFAPA